MHANIKRSDILQGGSIIGMSGKNLKVIMTGDSAYVRCFEALTRVLKIL